jgi:hypothetical protein
MDKATSSSESRCKNPSCGRLLPLRASGGHRQREYCDDNCRQAARRTRLEIARRQQCIEQVSSWGIFQSATIDYLANWLYAGNEEGARRLATLIQREQGQAPVQSDCPEKLLCAGEHITKLEKQVEIQQQRLRQYYARLYPSTLAVAAERLLVLGAMLDYKPLPKCDELMVEIAGGAQAWQAFARTANYDDLAQAIIQAERHAQRIAERRGNRDNQVAPLAIDEALLEIGRRLGFPRLDFTRSRDGTPVHIQAGELYWTNFSLRADCVEVKQALEAARKRDHRVDCD